MTNELQLTGLVEKPQKLIENAALVAKEFHKIVDGQQMFTDIQGKKHIHADGWSMLGVLLGTFPEVISTERRVCGTFEAVYVQRTNRWNKVYSVWTDKERMKKGDVIIEKKDKEEIKYSAVVALNTLGGRKLAQVTTTCSNREDGKIDNDEYAIESMAQTRGVGKVYRTAFGWIAKMAGYSATPFEEATAEMFEAEIVPSEPYPDVETLLKSIRDVDNMKSLSEVKANIPANLNKEDLTKVRAELIEKHGMLTVKSGAEVAAKIFDSTVEPETITPKPKKRKTVEHSVNDPCDNEKCIIHYPLG